MLSSRPLLAFSFFFVLFIARTEGTLHGVALGWGCIYIVMFSHKMTHWLGLDTGWDSSSWRGSWSNSKSFCNQWSVVGNQKNSKIEYNPPFLF